MLIKGLRITPFVYYSQMMAAIMQGEKSYDSLPNFTAADCELATLCVGCVRARVCVCVHVC